MYALSIRLPYSLVVGDQVNPSEIPLTTLDGKVEILVMAAMGAVFHPQLLIQVTLTLSGDHGFPVRC